MLHPTNIIRQEQNLYSNQNSTLISKCAKYALVMQKDGNLVIYSGTHPSHHQAHNAIWSSKSDGKGVGPHRVIMQHDGNLVIYDSHGHPTWASGTDNKGIRGNYVAKFKNGQLIVMDIKKQILWTSAASKKDNLLHQSHSYGQNTPTPVTPVQPAYPSAYPGGGAYPVTPIQPAYPYAYPTQPSPYQPQPGFPSHPTYPNKYY